MRIPAWTSAFGKVALLLGGLVGWTLLAGCGSKEQGAALPPGEPEGKVERLEGDALVVRGGEGTPVHLHLGDPLFQGDVVVTEAASAAEIRLVDGTILMVRAFSRMRIDERGAFAGEAPSVMLFWGRLLCRTLASVGEDRFFVDSPTLGTRVRGTEVEVAVAEDQGALVAVYHGKAEVEAEGETVLLGPQKEVEVEFAERPKPLRAFKEKTEADWTGWMSARTRELHNRLPDLATRMERRIREIRARRGEERAAAEKCLEEMDVVARAVQEAGVKGDTGRRQELVGQFQNLATRHRQFIERIQQMENRLLAAHAHAERLQKRAKGLKKELGTERYERASGSLKRVIEGKKAWRQGLAEDRLLVREQRKKSTALLEIVPEAKVSPNAPRGQETKTIVEEEKAIAAPSTEGDSGKKRPRSSLRPQPETGGKPPPGRGARGVSGSKSGAGKVQKAPTNRKEEGPETGKGHTTKSGAGTGASQRKGTTVEEKAPGGSATKGR